MTGLAAALLPRKRTNPRAGSYDHVYLNHQILAHEKLSSRNRFPGKAWSLTQWGQASWGHADSSCCWSLWRFGKGCSSYQAGGGISWSPCEQPPCEGGAGLRHLAPLAGSQATIPDPSARPVTLLPCWRMAVPSLSTGQPTGQGGPLHAAPPSASGQQAAVLCQG